MDKLATYPSHDWPP